MVSVAQHTVNSSIYDLCIQNRLENEHVNMFSYVLAFPKQLSEFIQIHDINGIHDVYWYRFHIYVWYVRAIQI